MRTATSRTASSYVGMNVGSCITIAALRGSLRAAQLLRRGFYLVGYGGGGRGHAPRLQRPNSSAVSSYAPLYFPTASTYAW